MASNRRELECLIAADLIASISARHSPAPPLGKSESWACNAANAARRVNERRAERTGSIVYPSLPISFTLPSSANSVA